MPAVSKVAVVGAGVVGMATALQLARNGVEVDLIESSPEIGTSGSGITIQGNALRAFGELGVWDDIRALGFPFEGLTLRAPGPGAPVVAELPDVKTGGPDYPAAMGIYRPDLAAVFLRHAEAAGARTRFGFAVVDLEQSEDGVEVRLADGSRGRYDLVVGSDGLNSTVRGLIGIDVRPRKTGMGIWRAFVSRPAEVVHSELFYGGPLYIAGYTPTGEDTMYAFLVEPAQDRGGLAEGEAARLMREESEGYAGPWDSIRADLAGGARVNYTWFTEHLVPAPWNRGRVVLIGDAAHSCPPTIAQGAAQGLEDAVVLTELLLGGDRVDEALWDRFHARRVPRARLVVEASVRLGQWQLENTPGADPGALIFEVAQRMAEPA